MLCGYFCFWRFYGYFPLLISFFGWVLLIQLESPNIGDLGFVALDNYCNRQRGKTSRYVLLQRYYKLELSACLYDKYLLRYEFSKVFEGFLSRLPSRRLRRTGEIFSPPTLIKKRSASKNAVCCDPSSLVMVSIRDLTSLHAGLRAHCIPPPPLFTRR